MPPPPVHIDYETFSVVNLKKCGLWPYAMHPTADVLCVAWAVGDGAPVAWWPGQPMKLLDELRWLFADHSRKFHAFNANFERAITEKVMARRYGIAPPKLSQWVDTQAIAAWSTHPASLERCARVLKLPEQKDKDGARLIRLFCIPRKDGTRVMPADAPDDFRRLVAYCKQDVVVDRMVAKALPVQELPPFEQKTWEVDSIINERGIPFNRKMARGATELRTRIREEASGIMQEITGGKVRTVGQRNVILAYCAEHGHPLPSLEKPAVAAALELPDLPTKVRDVLELRADSNMSSVAKYATMDAVAGADDRIRGAHAYCAASTHRWGGRFTQFQNIPRPHVKLDKFDHKLIELADYDSLRLLYGNVLPILRDAIRNTIACDDAHELFVVDKSSIEARVLGWLANDPKYMQAFREGLDLYKVTAAVIFGVRYEDVTDDQRWVGKGCVLGLGYGMGEDTFDETCRNNGRRLPRSLIAKSVKTYRKLYERIPAYWSTVENACVDTVLTGRDHSLPHGLRAAMVGKHLTISLPSGTRLWYLNAKAPMTRNKWGHVKPTIHFDVEINKKWLRVHTYGGRLVENIVQSVARDLLANALHKCDAAGLRPIMHVHDEIVCEPLRRDGHKLDEVHTIFRTPPPWAPGLPLGSSGFCGTFYKK